LAETSIRIVTAAASGLKARNARIDMAEVMTTAMSILWSAAGGYVARPNSTRAQSRQPNEAATATVRTVFQRTQ